MLLRNTSKRIRAAREALGESQASPPQLESRKAAYHSSIVTRLDDLTTGSN